jgi:hypothetical protein
LQTYSSNFPFERKFFQLFPFEQAIEPGSNVEKRTGRVIRRARQTWGGRYWWSLISKISEGLQLNSQI